jgi:hypothetical protein
MNVEMWVWAAAAGGIIVLAPLGAFLLPARTRIIVDTGGTTARAEMRTLFGMGPTMFARALPQEDAGNPLPVFGDTARISQALMTPGIADAAYEAVRQLFALGPKLARIELLLNLGDPAQNRVVETAVQAPLAVAPAAIRNAVTIGKCEAPGAELRATFELDAPPAALHSIYAKFKGAPAVREFRRRLKRKPKQVKRPIREVRAS